MQTVCNLRNACAGEFEQHLGLSHQKIIDVVDHGSARQFPFYDDPKQRIESDYAPDAVKDLSELAEAFADDYPTRKLIEKWIDGEAEHMAWEAQYLYQIEKLGYENFLIAMM